MSKSAEEGKIWEWRAFGKLSDALVSRVRAYPVRMGIKDIQGEDLYLISPDSDQNIKLRRSPAGWVLKFKLLFATRTTPIELYRESAEYTYPLPVPLDRVKEAAVLLATSLPRTSLDDDRLFDFEKLINSLAGSSPSVVDTSVSKIRSQFAFENGWFELADVDFEQCSTQSISVNSRDLDVVKEVTKQLETGKLEVMNYVEACRRWG
jgi:hypothetical protein